MNKVTMELRGLKELDQALRALPGEISAKVLMRALHDGARVIVAAVKRRAPVLRNPIEEPRRKPGAIRANVTQQASRHEYNTVLVRVRNRGYIFSVGSDSRRNAKSAQRAGNPNYWWLVEFGTSKAKAQPFLRPGFDEKREEAARAIQLSLLRGVAAVALQLGLRIEL